MYYNFGDRNFFELGILVDTEHSDTEFPMLLCLPYPDEEDLYQFAKVNVDINESWIDRKAVMDFIGMNAKEFDPVQFAIGCTSYYSWDDFGAENLWYGDWERMTKADICDQLQFCEIADDNLDVVW